MSNTIAVLRGKTSFAKVLGDPVGNKFDDTKNWTVDLVLTPEGVKEAKALGISDKIKRKEDYLDGQPHISFKQPELKKNGEKNKPIRIVDITGKDWDQEQLIGNGSDVDVKFAIADYGKGFKKGTYIRSIRVLKHVPFGGRQEFEPVAEDDIFYEQAAAALAADTDQAEREDKNFKKDFDLDDDIDDVL